MGTGAEVGGYGRSKVKGKTAGRSGLWDERGVGGVARRYGHREEKLTLVNPSFKFQLEFGFSC